MQRQLISIILLIICATFAPAKEEGWQSVLKEDYFREMAYNKDADPDMRIIWYDSLLRIAGDDKTEILLNKVRLLGEAGYHRMAIKVSEEALKEGRKLPLHQQLPLLYARANAYGYTGNYMLAFAGLDEIRRIAKPDSLKYWDVKSALSEISTHMDLGNYVKAKAGLSEAEAMIAGYPLKADFRADAAARIHGTKAAILIEKGSLDSAYRELKMVAALGRTDQVRMAWLIQTAQLHLAAGRNDVARHYLSEAMKLDVNGTNRRTAVYLTALTFLREKNYAEALSTLVSYRIPNIAVNTPDNRRAYYIIRGQAAAGAGYMAFAYNSLDSALVMGDSIVANIRRTAASDAEAHIQMSRRAVDAEKSVTTLKIWIILLGSLILLSAAALLPLLFRNIRLRREIDRGKSSVRLARLEREQIQSEQREKSEAEDLQSREKASMLLKLAHLETVLDSMKKKLSEGELNRETRNSLLHDIQEISGQDKMWELFSMQFAYTNRKFLDLLSQRHPELTKSEKRICAFMLMNLSTKEIASLLQRSPRTVDVTKYNIRKKLGITESTEEYLRQLAENAGRSV